MAAGLKRRHVSMVVAPADFRDEELPQPKALLRVEEHVVSDQGIVTASGPRDAGRSPRRLATEMRIARTLPVLCLALAVGSSDRPTAAATGGGQLSGRSTLAVKGCGKDRASLVLTLAMAADATWTARDQEASQFRGTYSARGASGRMLDLQFDAATSAGFVATVVSDVGVLCQAAATPSAAEQKRFRLQLNRKRTKATLSLTYHFAGTAGGRGGTAQYHALLKGPWVAGP